MGKISSTIQEIKIVMMDYPTVVKELRKCVGENDTVFSEILANFIEYNEDKDLTNFPVYYLHEILIKFKNDFEFNIVEQMKKDYVDIFTKYYRRHSKSYGKFY
jgi:hypothetical protein